MVPPVLVRRVSLALACVVRAMVDAKLTVVRAVDASKVPATNKMFSRFIRDPL